MSPTLRSVLAAGGLAFAMALPLAIPSPAAAQAASLRAAASPFCLLPGSTDGAGGAPQICGYFDWQACQQAAAVRHASCVVNIDFRGEVVAAPEGWRAVYPAGPRQR